MTNIEKARLSLVIAAKNSADRIEGCVRPWLGLASEIIVVDHMSTDTTPQIAERLGCRVLRNDPPDGNFDLNRKLGMSEARSDWILYLDTDERPTEALLLEVQEFLRKEKAETSIAGVRIPNQFYFLGKRLRFGLYNRRAAEIRMVRRGAWDYPCEQGFHRSVSVRGSVICFKNAYKHFNVNSLSEWFVKTNLYTELDAEKKLASGISIRRFRAFWDAFCFFNKHYFLRLGFLDGYAGLVSIVYFMMYHLTLQVKLWECTERQGLCQERDYLEPSA